MTNPETTNWNLVERAATDDVDARESFARRYQSFIRNCLASRWRRGRLVSHLDDAAQEVFLSCFKGEGALENIHRHTHGSFRAYLRGVARNTARQFEARDAIQRQRFDIGDFDAEQVPHPQATLSRAFDQSWARAVLRETVELLEQQAPIVSDAAVVRVEILRLRFRDGLPIRNIATRLGRDPAWVHHNYAKARDEFRRTLIEVLARRLSLSPADIESQWKRLMETIL